MTDTCLFLIIRKGVALTEKVPSSLTTVFHVASLKQLLWVLVRSAPRDNSNKCLQHPFFRKNYFLLRQLLLIYSCVCGLTLVLS